MIDRSWLRETGQQAGADEARLSLSLQAGVAALMSATQGSRLLERAESEAISHRKLKQGELYVSQWRLA